MTKGISTGIIAVIIVVIIGIAASSLQPLKYEVKHDTKPIETNPQKIPTPISPEPSAPKIEDTKPKAEEPGPQTPETQFTVVDNYPSISGSSKPSNPSLGDSFNLTISATDDKGVNKLSWQSSKPFLTYGQLGSFDCNLQISCSNSWQLITKEEGLHQITATAIDSSGKDVKLTLDIDVQPARPVKSVATTTSTTSTTTTTIAEDKCNSNSDCGYKERCASGKCIGVECTTDSHCVGCKRCSNYDCVSCGYGPYGCYC